MRKVRHPLSGSTYEWADDGIGPVHVTRRDGAEGRFDRNGHWAAGEVRSADPELCRWIASGGPTPPDPMAFSRRFGSTA